MATTPNQEHLPLTQATLSSAPVNNPKTNLLPALQNFLNVTEAQYKACIAHIDHDYIIEGINASFHLHYVRYDANGRPKFKELAEVLARHLGYYAVMAQRHSSAKTNADHIQVFLEAKKLLRHYAKSGEPGELLLYFLMEAVLKAPQAICKMSLKTNRKEEVKGSDGVHLRWDDDRKRLILYFGEAKLYKDLSSAISAAFRSMATFHTENSEEHEVFLAANHFNLLDTELKEQVCAFLDKTSSANTYEMHHACLIGFDWKEYGNLDIPENRHAFVVEFEKRYLQHGARIHSILNRQLQSFTHNHLTFEFFFLPFKSVQQFRDWFMGVVFGEVQK